MGGLFPNDAYFLLIHSQALGTKDKPKEFDLLLVEHIFARRCV